MVAFSKPKYFELLGLIYLKTNNQNGMGYIGSTTQTMKARDNRHRAESGRGVSKWHEAFRTIGPENFHTEIIEEFQCNTWDELERREFDWIEAQDPTTLYNTIVKYREVSEAAKAKMSAAQKGKVFSTETRAKMSAARVWKVATAETKAKMSAAHLGVKNPSWKGGSLFTLNTRSTHIVRWVINGKEYKEYFGFGPRSKYKGARAKEEAYTAAEAFKAALVFE